MSMVSSGVPLSHGCGMPEEVMGWSQISARDFLVFVRSSLKGTHNLLSYRTSWYRPSLHVSLVSTGYHFNRFCGMPEEVMGWDERFARDQPVFCHICLGGPHNL